LDPLASGLMILLLGRAATKKQADYMGQDKVYRCVMRCGVKTDSGDIMGSILEEKESPDFDESLVKRIFTSFLGAQEQIPPMYSALKKDGVPLYKLARKGQTVERKPRPVTIYRLELLAIRSAEIEFRLECSSGTYVRSLVEDIAAKLGTVAAVVALERETIGALSLETAVPGDRLKTMTADEIWEKVAS
jgi:tRNA pseudouridine55 synthase